MKKIIILILMLTILSFSVYSEEYKQLGGEDSTFNTGLGFFNEQLTDVDTSTKAVSDNEHLPLVADLDNDGTNEIIVIDGSNIRLYQNKTLDILDAYSMGSVDTTSNPLVFDIDGDGLLEFIVAQEVNEQLYILQYNNSAFTADNIINLNTRTHTTGEMMIACKAVNACIIVYPQSNNYQPVAPKKIYMSGFTSSGLGAQVSVRNALNNEATFCLPKIRAPAVADYDNDGITEYIISYNDWSNGLDADVYLSYINQSATNVLTIENTINVADDFSIAIQPSGLANCQAQNGGKYFSSPLVSEFDNSVSNGLETVIGFQRSNIGYRILAYDSNQNLVNYYPFLTNADGEMVSNVVKGNFISDTGDNDFCVMGYKPSTDLIDLDCGSLVTGQIPESREYRGLITLRYNVTEDYGRLNAVIHSSQQSTELIEGNNPDEIVTSYGIMKLDESTCFLGICDLEIIYTNPIGDSAVIMVDVENIARTDMIALTDTNIWYVDDKFENQPSQITGYTIDPCIDSTWKQNTSVFITITPEDEELDLVGARAILYYNTPYEQDSGWTSNSTSGTTFSFSLIANQTIGSSTLRLMSRDIQNVDDPDIIDVTISVSTNGLSQGDCVTTFTTTLDAEELINVTTDGTDLQNNAIRTGLTILGQPLGLGFGLLYLIVMCVVALAIWLNSSINASATIGTIGIIEILMLIIGVKLQLVSVGTLIVIIIIGGIMISLWLSRHITGISNQNG